jgi:hypothetical protein
MLELCAVQPSGAIGLRRFPSVYVFGPMTVSASRPISSDARGAAAVKAGLAAAFSLDGGEGGAMLA